MSFTGAKYDDLIVSEVKVGCVHVTLMIKNNLVPAMRLIYSPEKVSKTCQLMSKSLRHRINKVLIQDVAVYISGKFDNKMYFLSSNLNTISL